MIVETVLKVELPFKRIPALKRDDCCTYLPWCHRWFGWLYSWGGGSVGDCQGRTNTVRHLQLFRWHILTIHRNEYHDRSDKERADEYLKKWAECEKELRGLRLIMLGDETGAEVKRLIRELLGVNLDEGTIN